MPGEEERIDLESEQSMDASDPLSVAQPGLQAEPVASSTAPREVSAAYSVPYDERVNYFDCGGDGEQYPEEETWFTRLFYKILTWFMSLFNFRR